MSAKVLVVDDEAHIVHVVSLKLRNAGYDVVTAADGEEALDVVAAEKPDLIVTDFLMPRINGLEMCCRLRELGSTVPAILLTARGYALEPEDMIRAGIRVVLSKPFSPRDLLSRAQSILNGEEVSPEPDVRQDVLP